jgi:hypothetical protein
MPGKWKHGWIPLNAAAVASKRGKRSGGRSGGVTNRRVVGTTTTRKRVAAVPRRSGGLPKVQGISNPNHSKMSNADKVKAAAIMFGTGSKQHRAAQKRFR